MGKLTATKSGRVKNKKFKKDISVNDFDASSQESELRSNTTLNIKNPFKWTAKQTEIINLIMDDKTRAVFIRGEPGTGKTHLSVVAALRLIQQGSIENLVYIRSIVEAAANPQGFLPGNSDLKEAPYMQPLISVLEQTLPMHQIKALLEDRSIKAISNSFIRGTTMRDSLVIIDESQNFNARELKTIISRAGENTKMIFIFDPDQSDLRNKSVQHDVIYFSNIFKTPEAEAFGIHYREFDTDDIMRSPFCKFVMKELKKSGI
jgi:predicted ribonuclease YlaK